MTQTSCVAKIANIANTRRLLHANTRIGKTLQLSDI